jgi:hypothetical protein
MNAWRRSTASTVSPTTSWAVIGKNDQTVQPQLERDSAARMGAKAFELESSHVPMLSQPKNVLDIIRQAADSL